ncbi:MAG: hypothetical protein V7K40_13390 [Nostoc sp.]|uniref:hypothetical protein n=1 Tax=Nostoc sp. TaxID=1180 RepID=UPI002FFC9AE2
MGSDCGGRVPKALRWAGNARLEGSAVAIKEAVRPSPKGRRQGRCGFPTCTPTGKQATRSVFPWEKQLPSSGVETPCKSAGSLMTNDQ